MTRTTGVRILVHW